MQTLVGFERALALIGAETDEVASVPRPEGLQYLRMLLLLSLQQFRNCYLITAHGKRLRPDLANDIGQTFVVAGFEHGLVKPHRVGDDLLEVHLVARSTITPVDVLKLSHRHGIRRKRNSLRRLGLQQSANLKRLFDLFGGKIANDNTLVRASRDQSDPLQLGESSADLMSRCPELGAEVVFDKSFARPEPAKNDLVLDLINDKIGLVRADLFFQLKYPFQNQMPRRAPKLATAPNGPHSRWTHDAR